MEWSTEGLTGRKTGIAWHEKPRLGHVDPYLVWHDLTGFAAVDAARAEGVRVLAELAQPGRNGHRVYRTASVSFDDLGGLCEGVLNGEVISRFELSMPMLSHDGITVPDKLGMVPKTPDVARAAIRKSDADVVGFIDYGCAFAHPHFRVWENGQPTLRTRVAALWNQEGLPAGSTLDWSEPSDFRYGGQVFREARPGADGKVGLDQHIQACVRAGRVDERLCYQASGYRAIQRDVTHGTHLMDVATGFPNPLRGVPGIRAKDLLAPHDADIAFVNLPGATGKRPVGGMLRAQVLDGLRFILTWAKSAQRVVVNLSYGAYAGPHDGTSMLEEAIDQAVQLGNGRLQVVVAAGNARDKRLHAQATIQAGETATFLWSNLPDDPTDSFAEFWCGEADAVLSYRVVPPGQTVGDDEGWISTGQVGVWRSGQDVVASLVFAKRVCQGRNGCMALLAATGTRPRPSPAKAPHGQWRIEVRNQSRKPQVVDAWSERDEPAYGSDGVPRQARFSPSSSSRVVEERTLSSLAHGQQTKVVGAYVLGQDEASFSSVGDISNPLGQRHGPRWIAPSDEGPSVQGLPAAAVHSLRTVRLNGTSVAAAFATRRCLETGLPRSTPSKEPGPQKIRPVKLD